MIILGIDPGSTRIGYGIINSGKELSEDEKYALWCVISDNCRDKTKTNPNNLNRRRSVQTGNQSRSA